jgi:hypothetical protein
VTGITIIGAFKAGLLSNMWDSATQKERCFLKALDDDIIVVLKLIVPMHLSKP